MTMSNTAISIQNVKKSFGDLKAVNGISFEINKGEFVAMLGPNGASKTTLMEMVEGIQQQDSGDIIINGKTWKDHEDELHALLGISLQETHFFDKLKVKETVQLFASFYSIGDERCNEILHLVNLTEKASAYVTNLSGGQRQRLALGIALINNPEIILLDEPTAGLDPTARREIWDILFKLKKEKNITMILTTHYMEEADYLCDRIIILDKGSVLAQGTLDELLSKNGSSEIIDFSVEGDNSNIQLPDGNGKKQLNYDAKNDKWQLLVDDIIAYLPFFLEEMKKQNKKIKTLECRKMTLDDLFIAMTGRRLNE
ncbi:MAG: ABC transporter ATP-binding protein [Flavobacteriales bacterium]